MFLEVFYQMIIYLIEFNHEPVFENFAYNENSINGRLPMTVSVVNTTLLGTPGL